MILPDSDPAGRLYVITDRRTAAAGLGPVDRVVEAALAGGARLFQLRDKEHPIDELHRLGARLAETWRDADAAFLVNDRADLASCLEADGVHRPARGLPVPCLREVVGEGATIGISAHDLDELRAAEEAGADFATLSPIYPSPSKPNYGPALGPDQLERLVGRVDLPVFALGGITPDRVEACIEAGAHGVAVMSGVMAADAPKRAVRNYLEVLEDVIRP